MDKNSEPSEDSSKSSKSTNTRSTFSKYTFMEIYSTFVAAFSFLCIGLLRAYTSPAISSMKNDPNIFNTSSLPQKEVISWIASSPPLASFIGTVVSGPLLQYCGRQTTIVLLSLPYIIGWLCIGFAQNILMVLTGRILTGLSAGISTAAAQLYVSECVRPEVRGTLGFLPAMMLALGVLLGFAASTINVEWRELALIMVSLPAVLLIMSLTIPESPSWLILRGKEEKALRNLKKFRGRSSTMAEVENEIEAMKLAVSQQRKKRINLSSSAGSSESTENGLVLGSKKTQKCQKPLKILAAMKQRGIWLPAFIGVSLMIFQQFAGANVVIFFLTVILTEAEPFWNSGELIFVDDNKILPKNMFTNSSYNVPHLPNLNVSSSASQATALQFSHNVSSVIVGVVQFLAFFLSLPLIDRMGRKILLISSAILMSLPLGLLGFYFYCNVHAESDGDLEYIVRSTYSWLPLTCLCIFIAAYSIGYGPVPFIIMSEIFPSQARSYLCSLTSFSNHFFLFIVIKMFPMVVDWVGPHWTFWMFAGNCLVSILLVVFVLPETKGKTLTEIEKQFSTKEVIPLLRRTESDTFLP